MQCNVCMHVLYIYPCIYTHIYIYVHACIQVNIPTISPKLGELARRQGCMAMTLCRVHLSKSVLSRVSDDHAYPGVPEDDKSVARWWFQMFNQSIIWGFDQTYITIYAYFSLDSYTYNCICYIYIYVCVYNILYIICACMYVCVCGTCRKLGTLQLNWFNFGRQTAQ